MPRSPESREQRREYARQWRKQHSDYHRRWRAEHREAERERQKEWRAHNRDLVRAQRLRYYLSHPRPNAQDDPIPSLFQGHPFFDTARFICGPEPYFDLGLSWEEVMAEVVLALVEERDPNDAAVAEWRRQGTWRRLIGPLYPNVDVREDTREVVVMRRREDA